MAVALPKGDILSAYFVNPSKPLTPFPAVVGVGDCEIVLTLTFLSFPKNYPKLLATLSRKALLSAISL